MGNSNSSSSKKKPNAGSSRSSSDKQRDPSSDSSFDRGRSKTNDEATAFDSTLNALGSNAISPDLDKSHITDATDSILETDNYLNDGLCFEDEDHFEQSAADHFDHEDVACQSSVDGFDSECEDDWNPVDDDVNSEDEDRYSLDYEHDSEGEDDLDLPVDAVKSNDEENEPGNIEEVERSLPSLIDDLTGSTLRLQYKQNFVDKARSSLESLLGFYDEFYFQVDRSQYVASLCYRNQIFPWLIDGVDVVVQERLGYEQDLTVRSLLELRRQVGWKHHLKSAVYLAGGYQETGAAVPYIGMTEAGYSRPQCHMSRHRAYGPDANKLFYKLLPPADTQAVAVFHACTKDMPRAVTRIFESLFSLMLDTIHDLSASEILPTLHGLNCRGVFKLDGGNFLRANVTLPPTEGSLDSKPAAYFLDAKMLESKELFQERLVKLTKTALICGSCKSPDVHCWSWIEPQGFSCKKCYYSAWKYGVSRPLDSSFVWQRICDHCTSDKTTDCWHIDEENPHRRLCTLCWQYQQSNGNLPPQALFRKNSVQRLSEAICAHCGCTRSSRWHFSKLDAAKKWCQACFAFFYKRGELPPKRVLDRRDFPHRETTIGIRCCFCDTEDSSGGKWYKNPLREAGKQEYVCTRCYTWMRLRDFTEVPSSSYLAAKAKRATKPAKQANGAKKLRKAKKTKKSKQAKPTPQEEAVSVVSHITQARNAALEIETNISITVTAEPMNEHIMNSVSAANLITATNESMLMIADANEHSAKTSAATNPVTTVTQRTSGRPVKGTVLNNGVCSICKALNTDKKNRFHLHPLQEIKRDYLCSACASYCEYHGKEPDAAELAERAFRKVRRNQFKNDPKSIVCFICRGKNGNNHWRLHPFQLEKNYVCRWCYNYCEKNNKEPNEAEISLRLVKFARFNNRKTAKKQNAGTNNPNDILPDPDESVPLLNGPMTKSITTTLATSNTIPTTNEPMEKLMKMANKRSAEPSSIEDSLSSMKPRKRVRIINVAADYAALNATAVQPSDSPLTETLSVQSGRSSDTPAAQESYSVTHKASTIQTSQALRSISSNRSRKSLPAQSTKITSFFKRLTADQDQENMRPVGRPSH